MNNNDPQTEEMDDSLSYLNKKHRRTLLSNEEKIKLKRDMILNTPLEQRNKINNEKVTNFNAAFSSLQFYYNDISLFERELNYQCLNTFDILIIFYDYNIDDKAQFHLFIDNMMNSFKGVVPFFIIRLSLIGRIKTSKGQINLTVYFIEMHEHNTLNQKLNEVFDSFMVEENLTLSELIHGAISMNWKSNAKCIFLLFNSNEDELKVSKLDKDITAIATKPIEFHCILFNATTRMMSLFQRFQIDFIKASQVSHSCTVEEMEVNKDREVIRYIVKKSNYLMRYSLYQIRYVDDLLSQYKQDTLSYICDKYNANDTISLLNQIDTLPLTDTDRRRIELVTRKLFITAKEEDGDIKSNIPPLIDKDNNSVEQAGQINDEGVIANNNDDNNNNNNSDKHEEGSEFESQNNDNNNDDVVGKEKEFDKLIYILDFSDRNVIKTNAKVLLYDVSFSSIQKCICHSIKCLSSSSSINRIDWISPIIKHNQTEANIKISENIYLSNNMYSMAVYDYRLESKFKGTTPIEIYQTNDNLLYFLNQISSHALCVEISCKFNLHYSALFPHDHFSIKFIKRLIYEMKQYNAKYIIADQIPAFDSDDSRSNRNTQFDLDIKEAFSHFSYQITEGLCLIHSIDMSLNGVVVNYKFSTIANKKEGSNDYKDIIRFFLQHSCNDICNQIGLVHPKDSNNSIDASFYEKSEMTNNGPFICHLCNKTYSDNKEEVYCNDCIIKSSQSRRKANCECCHSIFEYNNYYYTQLTLQKPSKCNECIDDDDSE